MRGGLGSSPPRCLDLMPSNSREAAVVDRFGREDHGDEFSKEGARWREDGASVVHDLSDVLEPVARSDFALGCHA